MKYIRSVSRSSFELFTYNIYLWTNGIGLYSSMWNILCISATSRNLKYVIHIIRCNLCVFRGCSFECHSCFRLLLIICHWLKTAFPTDIYLKAFKHAREKKLIFITDGVNLNKFNVWFSNTYIAIWLKSDLYLRYRIEDLITPDYWSCSVLIILTNQSVTFMRLKAG